MEEYAVASVDGGFARSRERFEAIVAELGSPESGQVAHGELEDQLTEQGRELLRCLLQDHLDLRAAREVRLPAVTGADMVVRRTVERGHDRVLGSVFGEVLVTRMGYRVPGAPNVYPGDVVLNLPVEEHSHGLREMAVVESVRGLDRGCQASPPPRSPRKATRNHLAPDQRKRIDTTANHLIGNRRYPGYLHALEQGRPIATGIIEGACRHLVKDRMDLTGARRGLTGAEAVLKLRALTSNGDFDKYWAYHLQQEHRRVHQTARPTRSTRHRDQPQLAA